MTKKIIYCNKTLYKKYNYLQSTFSKHLNNLNSIFGLIINVCINILLTPPITNFVLDAIKVSIKQSIHSFFNLLYV